METVKRTTRGIGHGALTGIIWGIDRLETSSNLGHRGAMNSVSIYEAVSDAVRPDVPQDFIERQGRKLLSEDRLLIRSIEGRLRPRCEWASRGAKRQLTY